MGHILFFGQLGFFKRDFDRFYIKKLGKKFNVTFIDLSNLCNKNFYKKEKKNFFKCKELVKVDSLADFIKIIRIKKFKCAFDLSAPSAYNLNIFRKALNDNKVKLVQLQTGLVPNFKRNFFLKINYFIKLLIYNKSLLLFYCRKLLQIFLKRQNSKINFVYDYIFCIGQKGKVKKCFLNEKTKFIYGRSSDFETFKQEKFKKNLSTKTLLFIDQYLPYHNGYRLRGIPPYVNAKNYFKSLNSFFGYLEKKFKAKVVVAAHPRSNYKILGNKFNGRKIINFKETNKNISKCIAVINYTSTAMSFAVMHKKPIIFYTSNEINNSHDSYHVKFLSNHLGSSLSNIDNSFTYEKNLDRLLVVNENKYKKYFNNYICHIKSKKETNIKKIVKIIEKNKR